MRLLDVRHDSVSIGASIKNAYIDFSEMSVSVVALVTDVIRDGRRVIGYGFSSHGRYAVNGLLAGRFIRRLLNAEERDLVHEVNGTETFNPVRALEVLMKNEKPGGHGERATAVGVLDMALWDAASKVVGKPLADHLSDVFDLEPPEERIAVYAAGGYYSADKSTRQLRDELKAYLDAGFESVKIKVGGAPIVEDLKRIEAAIDVVGSGGNVAVDANGRFDLASALEFAKEIEPYDLKWFEEPGDPHDFVLQAALGSSYKGAFATGENLFASAEARNLVRHAGLNPQKDFLQFDPVLSYGIVEYVRTLEMLDTYGWSPRRCIPHGGHQLSLHLAAAMRLGGNEAYPGVFLPFGGFGDAAKLQGGYVDRPKEPGIGLESNARLFEVLAGLVEQDQFQ